MYRTEEEHFVADGKTYETAQVLKDHIVKGYTVNEQRFREQIQITINQHYVIV